LFLQFSAIENCLFHTLSNEIVLIMETELKLLVNPADIAAFRRHPLLKRHAVAKPQRQQLTSIYYDTPELDIRRHDGGLRVRKAGNEWVQTLKGGGQVSAGLHQRQEWESRVDGPYPDLPALQKLVKNDPDWGNLLSDPTLSDRLQPIFTTKVRRTTWQLRLGPDEEVELALDQGEVEQGAAHLPISEIELELKSGQPDHLFDFALELQTAMPIRVGNISKAERGYALLSPHPPVVVKATRLDLSPKSTVGQAFQKIVANCMKQMQGNEAGVAQGADPESVHQMRVGVRRLRSALDLFESTVSCPDELQSELRWLANQLGAARDWEVLADTTLAAAVTACPDEKGLQQLRLAASESARENRQRVADAVNSVRYGRLWLMLGAWMQTGWCEPRSDSATAGLAAPLGKYAANVLTRANAKLRKRGKSFNDGSTPQARHKGRIAAKKIRYATEFFQTLYPSGSVRRYLKRLSTLQDSLGWLNDASVADRLLQQLGSEQAALAGEAGFARGYLSVRAGKKLIKLKEQWRGFKQENCPWEK
jgi:inorganic triphosphatase YgiF